MALANYSDLVSSVTTWTHRADLTSVIPDFVKLAEVRIAQDLSIQPIEQTSTFDTVADQVAYDIPDGMVSLVRMYITENGIDYELNGSEAEYVALENTYNSRPTHYYVESNKINLSPIPDAVYTVSVVNRHTLDLQTDSTNAVMTRYPNVYLFATLIEAFHYTKNDKELMKVEQRYNQAIKDANRSEDFQDRSLLATELNALTTNRYSDVTSIL